jgi:hypothetical protein
MLYPFPKLQQPQQRHRAVSWSLLALTPPSSIQTTLRTLNSQLLPKLKLLRKTCAPKRPAQAQKRELAQNDGQLAKMESEKTKTHQQQQRQQPQVRTIQSFVFPTTGAFSLPLVALEQLHSPRPDGEPKRQYPMRNWGTNEKTTQKKKKKKKKKRKHSRFSAAFQIIGRQFGLLQACITSFQTNARRFSHRRGAVRVGQKSVDLVGLIDYLAAHAGQIVAIGLLLHNVGLGNVDAADGQPAGGLRPTRARAARSCWARCRLLCSLLFGDSLFLFASQSLHQTHSTWLSHNLSEKPEKNGIIFITCSFRGTQAAPAEEQTRPAHLRGQAEEASAKPAQRWHAPQMQEPLGSACLPEMQWESSSCKHGQAPKRKKKSDHWDNEKNSEWMIFSALFTSSYPRAGMRVDCSLQFLHCKRPQCRQWWRLLKREKDALHDVQLSRALSGCHGGRKLASPGIWANGGREGGLEANIN